MEHSLSEILWRLASVLALVFANGFDGLIATNTTLARPGSFAGVNESGGLSGAPLRRRSTEIIAYAARATQGRLPIIGVGGISDANHAREKLDAGASLVQIYSGMIYRGPGLAAEIVQELARAQNASRG